MEKRANEMKVSLLKEEVQCEAVGKRRSECGESGRELPHRWKGQEPRVNGQMPRNEQEWSEQI